MFCSNLALIIPSLVDIILPAGLLDVGLLVITLKLIKCQGFSDSMTVACFSESFSF